MKSHSFYGQILIILTLLFTGVSQGAIDQSKCFSCNIKVNSLETNIPLKGQWLFSRKDDPNYKNPNVKLGSDWVLTKAPGSWKKAYNDGKVFKVGWYRGTINFSKSLIGKKARLLFDTYMGRAEVYLDGNLIFERGKIDSVNRYFSIQTTPVTFKITKEKIRSTNLFINKFPYHLLFDYLLY